VPTHARLVKNAVAGGGFLQLIIIFYKRNKPKEFTWLIMHVQRACLNES